METEVKWEGGEEVRVFNFLLPLTSIESVILCHIITFQAIALDRYCQVVMGTQHVLLMCSRSVHEFWKERFHHIPLADERGSHEWCVQPKRGLLLGPRASLTSQFNLKVQGYSGRGPAEANSSGMPQCISAWRSTQAVSGIGHKVIQNTPSTTYIP